jgi:iron(III) transport system permease protein
VSRLLLAFALAVLAIVLWLPLGSLLARVNPADLLDCLDQRGWMLLSRTLLLAAASAAVALLIGFPLSWFLLRTDVPGAALLRVLCAGPLLAPPLLLAIAWTGLIDLRGPPAAVLVLGLGSFPLVAAATGASILRLDARAIEAAQLAGGMRAMLRLELRLALPAALAAAFLVFAIAAGDFAVCDYVSSVGPKLNVYADEIFLRWSQASTGGTGATAQDGAGGASYSRAVASALPLVALCGLGLLLALRSSRRSGLWSRADAQRAPEPVRLRAWRWPAAALMGAIVVTVSVLPLARMAFEASGGSRPVPGARVAQDSALPLPDGAASTASLPMPSPRVERTLAQRARELRISFGAAFDRARGDLRRSVTYGICAALVSLLPGLIVAHAIVRRRERAWARALEIAALLPLVLPGCVVGIGAIALWQTEPLAAWYGGALPGIAALAGRFAPLAVLFFAVALARQDPALEDAAAVAGAGPLRRMCKIVVPLSAGTAVLAGLAIYACSVRELDIAVLVPALNSTAIVRLYNGVHFARDGYVAALSLLLCASILLPFGVWTLARGLRGDT